MTMFREETIVALGAAGDGIVHADGQTFFVPGALPGETVRIREDGILDTIVTPSPARIEPICSLFGVCGGCSLQILRTDALLDWKMGRVERALRDAGFSALPLPRSFQTSARTRRRVDLAVRRVADGIVIGLHGRNAAPVDMTSCDVIDPKLFALLAPLRDVLASLGALTGEGTLQINLLTSGPDILISTLQELSSSDRNKLANFARLYKIPRISWSLDRKTGTDETVAQIAPVQQVFGPLTISPPPAVFLQASESGESAIAQAVMSGIPPLNRKDLVVELYAGCGTLTGPLAEKAKVLAYEGSAEAVKALRKGRVGLRFDVETRDLVRQPVLAKDLGAARVVVLDPPHTGAPRQIEEIAAAKVKDVVYVSCNPAALTKDAHRLAESGYQVAEWTVIDQFLWSAEVEAVVTFTRDSKRLKKLARNTEGAL